MDLNSKIEKYDKLRFYVKEELAADLVDVTDDDASPFEITTEDGTFAWREDIT